MLDHARRHAGRVRCVDARIAPSWLDRLLAGANALGAPPIEVSALLHLHRGELALEADAVELARECLEAAVRAGSGADATTLRHARALLADGRARLGDHHGEAELLDRLAKDEDDADARLDFYTAAAVAHLAGGDRAGALERARAAVALGPSSPEALAASPSVPGAASVSNALAGRHWSSAQRGRACGL